MLPKGPPQGKWAWPKRQGHHHNPSQERRHQQRAAGREMEAILKEQKTLEEQKADLQVRLQQQAAQKLVITQEVALWQGRWKAGFSASCGI